MFFFYPEKMKKIMKMSVMVAEFVVVNVDNGGGGGGGGGVVVVVVEVMVKNNLMLGFK